MYSMLDAKMQIRNQKKKKVSGKRNYVPCLFVKTYDRPSCIISLVVAKSSLQNITRNGPRLTNILLDGILQSRAHEDESGPLKAAVMVV